MKPNTINTNITFELIEFILDELYYCYNPGHDGQLFHTTDDCMRGFTVKNNIINLFILDELEKTIVLDKQTEYDNVYYLFSELLNNDIIYFDDDLYSTKQIQINRYTNKYFDYKKIYNIKPFNESLSKKWEKFQQQN